MRIKFNIEEFRYKKGDPSWDLKALDKQELIRALKKSHDTLWAGGKRNPTVAFDELAKMLLTIFGSKLAKDLIRVEDITKFYDIEKARQWKEL